MLEKLKLSNEKDREKIVELLSKGKVGLFPTDTVYGICCRMDNREAVEKIFKIKGRDRNKPFLVLLDSIDTAKKYIDFDLDIEKKQLLEKYWPGPLTAVFKANKENVDKTVISSGNTLAARIPDFKELRQIIEKLGTPIVAPSANLSGDDPPVAYNQVDKKIIDEVDFIVEGECKIKSASTIIDISESKLQIIRRGAIDIEV